MNNIVIRKATIEHASVVASLFDMYRVWYHQLSDIEAANDFIEDRITNNESVIFIAFISNKAVGFTQLYPIFTSVGMKKTWLLNDLFVTEEARCKGVAKALLDKATELGKETQSKWLMLQTSNDNYLAQQLYEKSGWIRETDVFYTLPL
jgi:GNAT superfamily N-acetyltransferase